jgi:hypothetical protein
MSVIAVCHEIRFIQMVTRTIINLRLYSILYLGEWSMRSSKPWVAFSDGSLGAAESAGPYHTKLRILFSYFLIKKCLRYFSSNPNNNLNYNLHVCLVPNYIVLCNVCAVNTHIM